MVISWKEALWGSHMGLSYAPFLMHARWYLENSFFLHSCNFNILLRSKVKGFFFSFLQPHLWHIKIPRPGVESELQLHPTPQPQQHKILAVSATYAAAYSITRYLNHWAMPGIELTFSRGQQQLLNPLSHNRNSLKDVNTDFKISCDFSIGPLGWAHCYQAPGFFLCPLKLKLSGYLTFSLTSQSLSGLRAMMSVPSYPLHPA